MKREIGQIYSIRLSDGSFTIAQLYHTFQLSKSLYVDTFVFFNIKIASVESLDMANLDLRHPFCIATINGSIRQYGWKCIGIKNIECSREFLDDIDSTGDYKQSSTDPSIFLEPYFGLFPWDGYFEDDYIKRDLLPNAEIRDDIKFMCDFSTEELKRIMPSNSVKLLERIKNDNIGFTEIQRPSTE